MFYKQLLGINEECWYHLAIVFTPKSDEVFDENQNLDDYLNLLKFKESKFKNDAEKLIQHEISVFCVGVGGDQSKRNEIQNQALGVKIKEIIDKAN